MLLRLLEQGNINKIKHHTRFFKRLIKANIITLDGQISDKTGSIIRDSEHDFQTMNKVLHMIICG